MATGNGGAVQAYNPGVLSGEVIDPTRVTSAQDNLGHQFLQVVRHLVLHSGAYHTEAEQTDHLQILNRYESATNPAAQHLVSETDHAPREDVSERVPPRVGGAVVPQAAPQAIDYNMLARAIVAVQNEQAAASDTPAKD